MKGNALSMCTEGAGVRQISIYLSIYLVKGSALSMCTEGAGVRKICSIRKTNAKSRVKVNYSSGVLWA